jgi:hypothetical protein
LLKVSSAEKIAPNAKSCSKVADQNRDMPSRASPLTSKIGYEYKVRSRVMSIKLGIGLGLQCRRKLFLIGELKARAKGPMKF